MPLGKIVSWDDLTKTLLVLFNPQDLFETNVRYSHLLPDMQRDTADLIDTKMKMSKKPEDQTTP